MSTAKPIAKPIVSRLASDGLSRRVDREYACARYGRRGYRQPTEPPRLRTGSTRAGVEAWFGENVAGAEPPLALRADRRRPLEPDLPASPTPPAGSWALRRPPLGKRLGSAHDMGARAQGRLGAGRRPRCRWRRWSGSARTRASTSAPFYVMEFVEGPILRGLAEAEIFPDEGDRRAIGERVADTLVADPRRRPRRRRARRPRPQGGLRRPPAAPLAGPVGEVEDARAGVDRPRPRARSRPRIPEQGPATIVHGDYRLDNMILTPAGEVAAVVDWELCTLGDPLADVGLLMAYWPERGEATTSSPSASPPTWRPGFPDPGRARRPLRRALRPRPLRPRLLRRPRLLEAGDHPRGRLRPLRRRRLRQGRRGHPRLRPPGRAPRRRGRAGRAGRLSRRLAR